MHPATNEIAPTVKDLRDTPGQIQLLSGAYRGSRCAIVTCGPSLRLIDAQRLRRSLEGVVTIAVKQAIDIVGEQADVLCFNAYNVSRYRVPSPRTIRVFGAESSGRVPQLNQFDIRLPHDAHAADLAESLVVTRDFDRYLLSSSLGRPWGPGILHEEALFLAVHLGVSEVITIGWDIANARSHNVHFYDSGSSAAFFDRGRSAHRLARARRRLPRSVQSGARWARALFDHNAGRLYNRTTMLPGEAEAVADATDATAKWLASHGVTLRVVSDSALISRHVPRIARESLYDALAGERC
jgi:hypothetical protein